MSRIPGIDPDTADPALQRTFEAQTKKWGAPLLPYPVYGRRPSIFRAVTAMWGAIDQSGLIETGLKALVNRRVASHNGCLF